MVGLKVSVMLVACTYMVIAAPITISSIAPAPLPVDSSPTAPPPTPECALNQFRWKTKCLPIGGVIRLTSPTLPKGTECPEHYQSSSDGSSCQPRWPGSKEPKCDDNDLVLNKVTFMCQPKPKPVSIGV
ncbi:unnamed protein product [Rhizoctonia solani]|uniref:Uncharacterized protein n=1 Tax=Rhizoctonia solani TaxID=456999 RepID=A0A8H3C8D1_9AGAM|nr:unnamed protein product [Rhizoctonia solani]